jgi:hypothetical protein
MTHELLHKVFDCNAQICINHRRFVVHFILVCEVAVPHFIHLDYFQNEVYNEW